MENNISERLEDFIQPKSSDNKQVDAFVKAAEEYEKLIREGLAKKRGFNIMTIGEIYTPNYIFNQSIQRLTSLYTNEDSIQ